MKNESHVNEKLYRKVAFPKSLHKSWGKVYSNGIVSTSETTRRDVEDFSKIAGKEINKIKALLNKKKFFFDKSRGVAIKRDGKSPRPIVIAPIPNRIVQRSILNVLQNDQKLKKYFDVKTSFGGLEDKSVSNAIELIHKKVKGGALFYARSDIKEFFTKIPRDYVLDQIKNNMAVHDPLFLELLRSAVSVELENLESLKEHQDLFPIHEEGVAQGSCLSPLFGNIFLHEFDKITNSEDVTCIRFIDDFVILGPSEKAVKAKLKLGLNFLESHKLEAYDPFENNEKAGMGQVKEGFEFLGCKVTPDRISPSKNSVKRIRQKISNRLEQAKLEMQMPRFRSDNFVRALNDVNNMLKGWGNSYQFCNNQNLLKQLDGEIDEQLEKFFKYYSGVRKSIGSNEDKRRVLGVHLLTDSKSRPIISAKPTK